MAVILFDNACGPKEVAAPRAFLCSQLRASGDTGISTSVGARGNFAGIRLEADSRWWVPSLEQDATTKHWYTYDVTETFDGGADTKISHSISGRVTSTVITYFAVGWERQGVGAGWKVRLWKLNFDAGLSPQNWTDVALGATTYVWDDLHTINVGYTYDSTGPTVDIEVWVDESQEIDVSGVGPISGQSYIGCRKGWAMFNWQKDVTKGGSAGNASFGNFIWNDETGSGNFAGRPDNDNVVVCHQFEADTSEAARDDWSVSGDPPTDQSAKYHRIDDNKGSHDPGADYIYIGQDTAAEQAFSIVDSVGASRDIDHIAVVAEVYDDGVTPAGKRAELECAPIATTGGTTWTAAQLDSAQISFRRKTLDVGFDLRIHQAYVLALGTLLTNPTNNDATDEADEAPTGDIGTYTVSLTTGFGTSSTELFYAMFTAPPAAAGVVPHVIYQVEQAINRAGTY